MTIQRKLGVKFKTAEALSELSDKLFEGKDVKLLPNMSEVHISADDISFKYRRSIRTKARTKTWEKHWQDLPEFTLSDTDTYANIVFFLEEYSDTYLSEILHQPISPRTRVVDYPKNEYLDVNLKRIITERGNPQYPIYIISKGRAKLAVTADHLTKMGVSFRLIVESAEYNDYLDVYKDNNLAEILHLDMDFRKEYDTYLQNFDDSKSKGSGPARNFVWWHSKNVEKSEWHWIMDDNIFGFYYYTDGERPKAADGGIFAAAEDFVNRYDNIGISGLNYHMFAVPGTKVVPYVANTKIYSCLLINNNTSDIRWAGRYNEDVDICIRTLKEGYSTIQFDAFLAKKLSTQTMGGGNTDAFYAEEGTLPKSNMLMNNHPDITLVKWRFQRWHHIIDYRSFKNYNKRSIADTIINMMKPVISELVPTNAIEEIKLIDFSNISDWNILISIDEPLRSEIIAALKYNTYLKDNKTIIERITKQGILNCNYYDYVWDSDIPDTEDNRIMKDLLKLGDEQGVLTYTVNWNEYLNYVQVDKRNDIKREMQRNKYLMKRNYKKHNYNSKTLYLSKEEHAELRDSRNELLNKMNGTNLPVPVTLYDKRVRKEVTLERNSFKSNLTMRGRTIKKVEHAILMVHGSEEFNNKYFFKEKMQEIMAKNPEIKELINSVYYTIDNLSANYALENSMKNNEFVPDETLYTTTAYKKTYKLMSEYASELVLFLEDAEDLSEDLSYLISEFESKDKNVKLIYRNNKTNNLDDWS